jgi:hypothetical protein
VYVQLLKQKNIEMHGKPTVYHPGDWVDVGKQLAQLWIAAGDARATGNSTSVFPKGAGVVMRGVDGTPCLEQFKEIVGIVFTNTVELKYSYTCLWDSGALPHIRAELLPTGFSLLDRWQLAVPFIDYTTLACNIGNEAERAATKEVIKDLRVPVYDTRLMFVKRSPDTTTLIREWRDECVPGSDERLAFLRVLYKRVPFILPLPATWTKGHGYQ